MAITFFIQSAKNPAPIYVRIREGKEIDAKAKSLFSVNPDHFKKGKIKLYKSKPGSAATARKKIQEKNDPLERLQDNLDNLKSDINRKLNNRKDYETINSKWLKAFLNPSKQDEIPEDLISYFDYYLEAKKNSLRPSTIKKNKVFKHRLEKYEKEKGTVYIREVNNKFARTLQKWCIDENYAHNTIVKTLKVIMTVCNHARENGIITHPELSFITKGLRYKNIDHIYLNFAELEKIINSKIEDETLQIARDWLIISCYTAQRVSDFLKFSNKDIKEMEGMKFLDISQEKTGKAVYIPLTKEVLKILEKREGNFPPIFSKNIESNKTIYNRLIKDVCQIAKINSPVMAFKKNKETNRYEEKEMPKYKAVSTHIGRRSFATNYYGRINTALLINATGHASETQFLKYVGKSGNQSALSLAKAMRELAHQDGQEPQLKVIKNAVNS
jgi:integrase